MIRATSEGDPQSGQQASIRIEGSDTWLPALVPVHGPRGSRTSTTRAVPVVGCFVDNRFVLSWADMRCRSVTDAPFPAECDGADQRNVAVEDTAAAISFVKSLTQAGRRPPSPPPSPSPPPFCADTAGGAKDSAGDGCEWYDAQPFECGTYDDSDFTSSAMCCACGG
eukprot:scaffold22379_cov60-Phaeocystis_antarctica.AAC.1